MSVIKMSDEERNRILNKHKEATKSHYLKKEETKKGLQQPNEKKPE